MQVVLNVFSDFFHKNHDLLTFTDERRERKEQREAKKAEKEAAVAE